MGTPFTTVYNRFLGKITDDLYVELTPEDTIRDLSNLLTSSLHNFEFPRKSLDYKIEVEVPDEKMDPMFINDNSSFYEDLTDEEINIIASLMLESWIARQVASIENTRMKYSGSDFKFTSQANHLSKLISLLNHCKTNNKHL